MSKVDLIVRVDAELCWLDPPRDTTDRMMREQANVLVKSKAAKLDLAVKLMLAEMLADQVLLANGNEDGK